MTDNELVAEVMSTNDLLVVALFDGWTFYPDRWEPPSIWIEKFVDGHTHSVQVRRPDKTFVSSYPTLKYDKSWDWIMPVVENIEKIKGIHTVISELGCDIYSFGKRVSDSREDTKIKTVYKAVVEFVKWYNSQK